jgi:hypothetical protein
MPSIASLVPKLTLDFPDITFSPGERFHWHPETQTISYIETSDDFASLLHEIGHAALGHTDFNRDIELIEMERDAWQYAVEILAPRYDMMINPATAEDALDTYRDWLHTRSICPACQATGVQIKQRMYRCMACRSEWTVNDARQHALRRHLTKKRWQ